jgi:hypothetical protein
VKSLLSIFPRASQSFIEANPPPPSLRVSQQAPKIRRGVMNKIETEFAMILQAQRQRGDILRYEFEGITLRFASVRYTPDFVVFPPATAVSGQVKLIEVKGPFIKGKFERAIERFRHARTYYGDVFLFELHQRTRQGWRRIL